ncbi:MAG: hypothetical protein P4L59_13175 [Desulfosporosinus sp.]|nr:hypothetical protein [Desulfosporosinus sp.]
MTIGGSFSFQLMISSKLILIIYAFGAVGVTVSSLVLMSGRFLWEGIIGIIVGNLVWKLVCETAIIYFRISDPSGQLAMIHQELKRSVK